MYRTLPLSMSEIGEDQLKDARSKLDQEGAIKLFNQWNLAVRRTLILGGELLELETRLPLAALENDPEAIALNKRMKEAEAEANRIRKLYDKLP